MNQKEYFQALTKFGHPKHKEAMAIRAKKLKQTFNFSDEQEHWNKVDSMFRTLQTNPFN